MPHSFRSRQAGEGKVGCIVTLGILVVVVGALIKAGPVYYSNNELISAINNDIAPMASRASEEEVLGQIRAKAKDLEIPEALKGDAIRVTITPPPDSSSPGNINIKLNYDRTVDFYGIYSYTFSTHESIDRTVFQNIK